MTTKSHDGKIELKACPWRVCTGQHPAVLKGSGDIITQKFYPCMGESCAAYYNGLCLRAKEAVMEV